MFVFDLLFNLFMIALWPSVGKELSLWLFTCVVFILIVGSLSRLVLRAGSEFDCISSWSLPFYLLLSYFRLPDLIYGNGRGSPKSLDQIHSHSE